MVTFRSSISEDYIIEHFPRLRTLITSDLSSIGSGSAQQPSPPLPAIAPFWADLLFEDNTTAQLYVKIIREEDGLERFGNIGEIVVAENPSFSGFVPRTVVVASWFQPKLVSDMEDVVRFPAPVLPYTVYHQIKSCMHKNVLYLRE